MALGGSLEVAKLNWRVVRLTRNCSVGPWKAGKNLAFFLARRYLSVSLLGLFLWRPLANTYPMFIDDNKYTQHQPPHGKKEHLSRVL